MASSIVVGVVGIRSGAQVTTIVANLAANLAAVGNRVLAVDLDPRGDLRWDLGGPGASPGRSDLDVVTAQSVDELRDQVTGVLPTHDLVLIDVSGVPAALVEETYRLADGVLVVTSADLLSIQTTSRALKHVDPRVEASAVALGVIATGVPESPSGVVQRVRGDLASFVPVGIPVWDVVLRSRPHAAWLSRSKGALAHEMSSVVGAGLVSSSLRSFVDDHKVLAGRFVMAVNTLDSGEGDPARIGAHAVTGVT